MQKGFNSDITVAGTAYHVQTEDWGWNNPYLVSRIFRNGAVVKSIKRSYHEALHRPQVLDPQAIRRALQYQHDQILDLLLSGQLLP